MLTDTEQRQVEALARDDVLQLADDVVGTFDGSDHRAVRAAFILGHIQRRRMRAADTDADLDRTDVEHVLDAVAAVSEGR